MHHPVLTDPAALAAQLAGDTPPVVLDVRWTLAGSDRAAFERGHIPGAVFVDLDADLTAPPGIGGRHPIPDPAVLDGLLSRAGVDEGRPIVVSGQADTSVSARAWWLLRWAGHGPVTVLDGGFDAWRAAGRPVETGPDAAPGGGTARTRPGQMPTVDADGAERAGADPGRILVDARSPERYRGEIEPVDPVAGHIPGAVNLPLAQIHRADGRLRDPEELRDIFAGLGLGDGRPAAASCGSGVTACSVVLAGAVVGIPIALYPGSYSGWCSLGRPVVTGAGAS